MMEMISQNRAYIAITVMAVGLISAGVYTIIKAKRATSLEVIKVDTSMLKGIRDETLLNNLFIKACETFSKKLEANDPKVTHQIASTCYSLYKQIKEGDADEFDRNKATTAPEKYHVWLQ